MQILDLKVGRERPDPCPVSSPFRLWHARREEQRAQCPIVQVREREVRSEKTVRRYGFQGIQVGRFLLHTRWDAGFCGRSRWAHFKLSRSIGLIRSEVTVTACGADDLSFV